MPKKQVASSSGSNGARSRTPSPGRKRKGGGSKNNQKEDSAQAANDDFYETTLVQNPEIWRQALDNLGEITRRGRTADDEDIRRTTETKEHLLGHAVLRFIGPGEIQGVLNMDQSPDERHNPRELDEEHVRKLAEEFSRGNIKDRGTPVRVKVPPDSIHEDLRKRMQEADPNDPKSEIPTLELQPADTKRERQLELQILVHSDGDKLLSDQRVVELRKELTERRAQRAMARLINGNHRVNAMVKAVESLRAEASAIIDAERNKEDGIKERWSDFAARLARATYTVEVYSADTPDHVLAWLAENEDDRPNYAPRAGERLWSILDAQEALVRHMLATDKATSRIVALNKIMDVVESRAPTDDVDDATILAAMRGFNPCGSISKKGRGDESMSVDSIASILLQPAMNAMAVDTSRALWVYNERMVDSHIQIMRKDLGAPLIGHYWMAIRLLLKVANVARGEGLEAAEEYLAGVEKKVTDKAKIGKGFPAAAEHWANLHKNSQRTPGLLCQYGNEQVAVFDGLMRGEMERAGVDVFTKDYANEVYISALRRVFWKFGQSANGPSEYARRFSASIRLYALLPLWEEGCDDDRFFPAALLPNRQYVANYAKRLKSGSDTPGLWVLECLLDRHQLAWTAGAVRTSASQNTKNWYARARGTHQILLRLTQAEALGGRDAQLQTAMNIFDSPAFFSSLAAIDKYLTAGGDSRTSKLVIECSARKSSVGAFPIIDTVLARGEHRGLGDADELREALLPVRQALRKWLFQETGSIEEVLSKHEVLSLIPLDWWRSFDLRAWARGWNDPSTKWMNTTACLIGWGFVTQEMAGHVVPETLQRLPAARHLLEVTHIVARAESSQPWWANRAPYSNFPQDDEGESEKDELEAEEDESEPGGRQSSEPPRSHVRNGKEQAGEKPARAAAPPDQSRPRISEAVVQENRGQGPSVKPTTVLGKATPRATTVVLQTQAPSETARHGGPRVSITCPGHVADSDMGADLNGDTPDKDSFASAVEIQMAKRSSSGCASPNKGLPVASEPRPTTADSLSVFSLVRSAAPPHIRFGNTTLPETPGNLLARRPSIEVGSEERHVKAVVSALEASVRTSPQFLNYLTRHRMELRQSICAVARHCERPANEFPYVLEYSVAGLVRNIALCRDIFVARVAQSFAEVYGGSAEAARAEAILIAECDGLYKRDLVTIDPSTGSIRLDFRGTFPSAAQQEAGAGDIFVSETTMLPGDPDEVSRAIAAMDPFMPVHGYGHSFAMMEERGALGAAIMAGNEILRAHDPPQAMAFDPSVSDVSLPGQAEFFRDMVVQGPNFLRKLRSWPAKVFEEERREDSEYQSELEVRRVAPGYKSPWSTGDFDGWTDAEVRRIAGSDIAVRLEKLQVSWKASLSRDIAGYQQSDHGPNATLSTSAKHTESPNRGKKGSGQRRDTKASAMGVSGLFANKEQKKRRRVSAAEDPSLNDEPESEVTKRVSGAVVESPPKRMKLRAIRR